MSWIASFLGNLIKTRQPKLTAFYSAFEPSPAQAEQSIKFLDIHNKAGRFIGARVIKANSANFNLRISVDGNDIFEGSIRTPTSDTGEFFTHGRSYFLGSMAELLKAEEGGTGYAPINFSNSLEVEFEAGHAANGVVIMYETEE